MHKDLWTRKKPKAICKLKPYEWNYLARILEKGYPFLDALKLVRCDLDIRSYLENGYDIKTILLMGHKGRFYEHLSFFLTLSSLLDAITCALALTSFEKELRKKLIKQTSYPILIFMMAFATLYFFSMFIIPQMLQSFDMQEENWMLTSGVTVLKYIAQYLSIAVCSLLAIIIGCVCSIVFRKKVIGIINKFITLPADICSYSLAGYLAQMHRYALSTQTSFSFLCQLKQDTILHTCVMDIDYKLKQGVEITDALFQQAFINTRFLQSFRIGMHTQNMQEALYDLMQRQEDIWMRLIKKVSMTIQVFAYSFVAVMVLLVYQIMLVPLQILETM